MTLTLIHLTTDGDSARAVSALAKQWMYKMNFHFQLDPQTNRVIRAELVADGFADESLLTEIRELANKPQDGDSIEIQRNGARHITWILTDEER